MYGTTDKERKVRIMKRYLVKTVCKATANNMSYGGETHTYISGVDGYLLLAETRDKYVARNNMTPRMVRQHGYMRECDAKRSYAYKHPENTEYWQSTSEIVAYEIWSDEKMREYLKQV